MITGKKILVVATVDSMIGCFLLPHIKRLQQAGNTVECACHETGFWFKEMADSGLVVHEINFAKNPLHPRNIKAQKQLDNLVKNGNYNLIHCQTPVGSVLARRVAKKYKIPVIYVAHGFHFFKEAPLKNKLIFKPIEKHYAKYTDVLVTMNNEDYIASKKMKAKHKFKVSGIGYDSSKFTKFNKSELDELKKELNVEANDVVMVSVGELNGNKNHLAILKSLTRLANPNLKYFICGRGDRKEEYEKFIKKHNLTDNVKLLGYRRDINKILSITDIFAMPSLREGLPMSMIEAMNFGIPMIAYNIRGCNDLIKHGENGYLVDRKEKYPFDAEILKLVNDKNLRQKMGAKSLDNAKEYSIENVLAQFDEIYKVIE